MGMDGRECKVGGGLRISDCGLRIGGRKRSNASAPSWKPVEKGDRHLATVISPGIIPCRAEPVPVFNRLLSLVWFWKLRIENARNHLARQQTDPSERPGLAPWSGPLVIELYDGQQALLRNKHGLQFLLSFVSGLHHCNSNHATAAVIDGTNSDMPTGLATPFRSPVAKGAAVVAGWQKKRRRRTF